MIREINIFSATIYFISSSRCRKYLLLLSLSLSFFPRPKDAKQATNMCVCKADLKEDLGREEVGNKIDLYPAP